MPKQDAKKLIQDYLALELKENDTFQFECSMCGDCCRKRDEPIMLTGPDIFHIAQGLNRSPAEAALECAEWMLGTTSHLPVLYLRERLDGSCRLLRNGRCMVQKNKPAVCALFPLGRFFDAGTNNFYYFRNDSCKNGRGNPDGKIWTLGEWLEEFGLRNSEEEMRVWSRLMAGFTQITMRMRQEDIKEPLLDVILGACYFKYDTDFPYVPQVEAHIKLAKELLPKVFPLPPQMRLFD